MRIHELSAIKHFPQALMQEIRTLSIGLNAVTPNPTFSTTPTPS
jgi:hypothetical protein